MFEKHGIRETRFQRRVGREKKKEGKRRMFSPPLGEGGTQSSKISCMRRRPGGRGLRALRLYIYISDSDIYKIINCIIKYN
jgi:hypothetical protein